jgi:ferredoxin
MARPMWLVKLIKLNFKNRFIISRWTKKSALVRRFIDYLLFEDDEIYYLPKDRLVINQSIEKQEDVVLPSDIVRHFIGEAKHIAILNKCICRESDHCKDYPVDLGCIMMGDATLKISPRLAHQATKEEALAHLQRANSLGMVHLVGRNKLDTIWLGATPGDHLLTVCNCCPCCCLYKVLPDLDISISKKITRAPGVTVTVDYEKCIGCGKCARKEVCFVNAIEMVDGCPVRSEVCVGCGRCVEVCPQRAIKLNIGDENYIETTVNRLTAKVDVK